MIFKSLPGKYKVFVAGFSTTMKITEVYDLVKPLGKFQKLACKVRQKNPKLNLGYGVLTTDCAATYDKLINMEYFKSGETTLFFKVYIVEPVYKILQDRRESCLYLTGFDRDIENEILQELIQNQFGNFEVETLNDPKKDLENSTKKDTTEEIKVVRVDFKSKKYKDMIHSQFPMRIGQNIVFSREKDQAVR
jgi:hypothetical protein